MVAVVAVVVVMGVEMAMAVVAEMMAVLVHAQVDGTAVERELKRCER